MNISDPIADMLTRVRNASRARHTEVVVPASRTSPPAASRISSGDFAIAAAAAALMAVWKCSRSRSDSSKLMARGMRAIQRRLREHEA